jgi:thymidylate synthase
MHYDYQRMGMSDFICTNTVQYVIRHDHIYAIVNMRSNDAIFGYNNDWQWQQYVLQRLADELHVLIGGITWQVGSLHIYERHFYLVDNYIRTKQTHISKEDYRSSYPESPWAN